MHSIEISHYPPYLLFDSKSSVGELTSSTTPIRTRWS